MSASVGNTILVSVVPLKVVASSFPFLLLPNVHIKAAPKSSDVAEVVVNWIV